MMHWVKALTCLHALISSQNNPRRQHILLTFGGQVKVNIHSTYNCHKTLSWMLLTHFQIFHNM